MTDAEPPLQLLWHYRDRTCTMSSAAQPSPYWVVIAEGEQTISRRSFDDHYAATSFAMDELRRASQADAS